MPYSKRNYTSTSVERTLAAVLTIGSTTLTLDSDTGISGLSMPFTLVIDPDISGKEEIITVLSRGSGNTWTVNRGSDGTAEVEHSTSAKARHMITARDLQEPQNHIVATGAYSIANPETDASVTTTNITIPLHGLGSSDGVVVGTDKTQTLTAKTLASPTITGTVTGSVITNANITAGAAIDDTKLATIATAGKVANTATTATNANTASTIVARDASGNFTAGTVTAALTGNASTATSLATARTINGISFNGTANIKTHVGGIGTTSATTYDRITHGLGTTPSSYSITLRSNATTSSVRSFYITNVNPTYFDVYANDASGTQVSAGYYWIAIA